MARKAVPKTKSDRVLLASRRRCCICYGLNRDTSIKQGQIAHLDQNNSNGNEDNLSFLCLEHHNQYDGTTKQSRGLSIGEVKQFRGELLDAISGQFSLRVHFGSVSLPESDPYAGKFVRVGAQSDSAEVEFTPLSDSLDGYPRYAVTGVALWGTQRAFGPNLGGLEFIACLVDNELAYSWEREGAEPHTILIRFDGTELVIEETNWVGAYGMNVTFNGKYQRA
ncbi:hypothetical protein EOB77_05325 [Mesorhizobium sp. M7A.F.Ca.MR.228.00.0.0]|nr:hypothetical protein EOB80_21090 [Mesorhizobium sp. M7A.F.Ca.MR.245.00.0.0]RUV52687.1 hypothetical protein EOB77_05325 [Mesorhizobium sp. M7A.F.Ca.MR.228.00.0.0]